MAIVMATVAYKEQAAHCWPFFIHYNQKG